MTIQDILKKKIVFNCCPNLTIYLFIYLYLTFLLDFIKTCYFFFFSGGLHFGGESIEDVLHGRVWGKLPKENPP